eukprot:1175989-Prorocentrum_minimum.AAC.1
MPPPPCGLWEILGSLVGNRHGGGDGLTTSRDRPKGGSKRIPDAGATHRGEESIFLMWKPIPGGKKAGNPVVGRAVRSGQ